MFSKEVYRKFREEMKYVDGVEDIATWIGFAIIFMPLSFILDIFLLPFELLIGIYLIVCHIISCLILKNRISKNEYIKILEEEIKELKNNWNRLAKFIKFFKNDTENSTEKKTLEQVLYKMLEIEERTSNE